METVALIVILGSILATLAVSVCLSFDEAFGDWHKRPFKWYRRYRRRRRHRFGRHGRHRIHKRDIKLSLRKNNEVNLDNAYSDIVANQDLVNNYIANNTNIDVSNTKRVANGTKLDLLNDIVTFAKSEGKNSIIIK